MRTTARPVVLTGKDNQTVKSAARLAASSRERKRTGLFFIEGVRLCLDAAESGCAIKAFFYTESAALEHAEAVSRLSQLAEEVYITSEALFSRLCDTVTPQGICATVYKPSLSAADIDPEGCFIALENTQDPANLGAVARTAEALGIDGIIVSGVGCDPYSPKAQRAAMGSLLRIPVTVAEDFCGAMTELRERGMTVAAAVVRGAEAFLGEERLGRGTVVMIGNEGNGLTEEAIALASRRISIKMKGRSESLNAAAAAALFIWEMTK